MLLSSIAATFAAVWLCVTAERFVCSTSASFSPAMPAEDYESISKGLGEQKAGQG